MPRAAKIGNTRKLQGEHHRRHAHDQPWLWAAVRHRFALSSLHFGSSYFNDDASFLICTTRTLSRFCVGFPPAGLAHSTAPLILDMIRLRPINWPICKGQRSASDHPELALCDRMAMCDIDWEKKHEQEQISTRRPGLERIRLVFRP